MQNIMPAFVSPVRLLKYRGIDIGEVLYSDPREPIVFRATEIQRMFSLINGADEFVKFGSVEAIGEYFGSNRPEPLNSLPNAMQSFSEAFKICRTSAIESELKNLGRHIQTFRECKARNIQSELFAKIIDTIQTEYGTLLEPDVKRLDIIRWCMRKGFWQQAMTLCTEWLPEELVDRGICKPKDRSVANDAELDGLAFGRGWKQQLIIAYQGRRFNGTEEAPVKRFCNQIDERKQNTPAFRKNFGSFMRTIEYDRIALSVANFSGERLLSLFEIDESSIASSASEERERPREESPEKKWANRAEQYRMLMSNGTLCSDLDEAEALELLHGYYDLRNERNPVNHANSEATKGIEALKGMIEEYLARLERY